MSEANSTPLLSASQRRIVGFALTLLALLGSAALLIGAVMVIGRLIGFFSGVLGPLAIAGVLALILRPVVDLFELRLRLRRLSAVLLLYAICLLLVAGAIFAVLPPLIDQLDDFIAYQPTFWLNAKSYIALKYPQWIALTRHALTNPTVRQIADNLSAEARTVLTHALPALRTASGGFFEAFTLLAHAAIVPIYLFFFLLARGDATKNIPEHLPFLRPELRQDISFLVREFVGIIEAFFRGQILIGLLMGVLLALGFSLVGLKFGLFIGLVLGVLNIVPYLGTIIGLAGVLPLAFFQPGGGWQLLGLVLAVKLFVQAIESWFLTPRIMGHRTGLHPVAIIVAIFFWGTALNGLLGLLLAIPLTAFFATAWRLIRMKYFPTPFQS